MAKSSEPIPALVLAAQELEDELRRCEDAAAEAAKIRLNSEKHLTRAARTLKTAGEHREALGARVAALLAAINAARERADGAAARMEARAGEINARAGKFRALQATADGIAAAAREATESAKQAGSPKEILDLLGPLEERVGKAQQDARADDFEDVVHDLAALKETLAGLRRKLEGR